MPKKPESEKRNSLFLRAMHRTFLPIQGEKSGAVKKASFLTAPKFRLMIAPGRYFISDEEKCSRLHGSVRRIGLGLRICRVQLDIKPGDKLHQSYKVCYADHSVAVYVGHMCDDIVAGYILHQPNKICGVNASVAVDIARKLTAGTQSDYSVAEALRAAEGCCEIAVGAFLAV